MLLRSPGVKVLPYRSHAAARSGTWTSIRTSLDTCWLFAPGRHFYATTGKDSLHVRVVTFLSSSQCVRGCRRQFVSGTFGSAKGCICGRSFERHGGMGDVRHG